MLTFFRHAAAGLVVLLVQWLVLGRLALWGATPDAVLLFVAWLGLRHGRRYGAIGGFVFGFFMDAIYGLWGIHMFAKTLTGFLLGLFPARERETLLILPRQALVGGLVIALLHNGVVVTLLALESGASNTFMATALWLGSSLYTAFVGFVAALFNVR
ncbi:rod shape-determining protein MreD [Rhodocaloribacter litoris]|uniref:rod shape-determining protein MreD n=1 Tax=Rhodocaloribacter litoris TaxID=2558931 RepID=UPI001420AF9C|nr:rod shape-determining protein MreD [Rhodocaloribacter litoris]QXD14520.1 rod shape-determining protein MreD [Rhodocaloribacter litoris]